MTGLTEQISKLRQRVKEHPDPLLHDVIVNLERLQKLDTIEGLLEFHEKHYVSRKDAAKLTGINYNSIKQYVMNYIRYPESRRTKLPAIAIQEGSGAGAGDVGRKTTYLIPRKALHGLKQPQKKPDE